MSTSEHRAADAPISARGCSSARTVEATSSRTPTWGAVTKTVARSRFAVFERELVEDVAGCRSPPRSSEHLLATHAIGEIVGDVLDQLALEDGEAVDLATVFVTAPHVGVLEDVASTVRALQHAAAPIGVLGGPGARWWT